MPNKPVVVPDIDPMTIPNRIANRTFQGDLLFSLPYNAYFL